jgi:hypothetical protein
MIRSIPFLTLSLCVVSVASIASGATIIDFEPQAANAGPFLTGIPDSPLTIGIATFTGGELRHAEIGLFNQTGVYATEGVFGSDSNPIHIQFSTPINDFSVNVLNGENTQTYTVSDNLGETMTASTASAGAGGSALFTLPGLGITSVDISSANMIGWNFAIDQVSFDPTPEPASLGLVGLVLLLPSVRYLLYRRRVRPSNDSLP